MLNYYDINALLSLTYGVFSPCTVGDNFSLSKEKAGVVTIIQSLVLLILNIFIHLQKQASVY